MKATFKEINKNKLSLRTFLKMKDEKVAKLKVKKWRRGTNSYVFKARNRQKYIMKS